VPPHLQKAYMHLGYKKGAFPIAEELAATSLSLPLYPGIKTNEITYTCDCIKSFFEKSDAFSFYNNSQTEAH
jgi:dTDP-4-amino-4,6-dideoxygalactose transaminase